MLLHYYLYVLIHGSLACIEALGIDAQQAGLYGVDAYALPDGIVDDIGKLALTDAFPLTRRHGPEGIASDDALRSLALWRQVAEAFDTL